MHTRTIDMSDELNRSVKLAAATMEMSAQGFIAASLTAAVATMASRDPEFAALLRARNILPHSAASLVAA
jgi:hypothetical protein